MAESEPLLSQRSGPEQPEQPDVSLNFGSGGHSPRNGTSGVEGVGPSNVIYGSVHEVPPVTYSSVPGGPPTIICKVCEELIDISGKRDQHVVKCHRCGEATPIKNAPPGRKYVRCQCKCLLICKTTSSRIACPRVDCDVVINFAPTGPPVNPIPPVPGLYRIECAYCRDTFLFDATNNTFATCPHCGKISSISGNFSRNRGVIFTALGLMLLIVAISVTAVTAGKAPEKRGLYFLYVVLFCASLALLLRGGYFLTLRKSHVQPNSNSNGVGGRGGPSVVA